MIDPPIARNFCPFLLQSLNLFKVEKYIMAQQAGHVARAGQMGNV